MSKKSLSRIDLKGRIDRIDSETVLKGLDKYGEAWLLAKRGMWLKGREILKDYPGLAKKPALGGRGVTAGFSHISRITGRYREDIKRWVEMVKHVGSTEAQFKRWAKLAVPKAVQDWKKSLPKC